MHSVHQTAWFGAVTTATSGDGKKAGATRTFSEGPYNFVEEQSGYKTKDCGGFESKYIQHDGKLPQSFHLLLAIAAKSSISAPITFDIPGAPQTYAGQWDTLAVAASGNDKTSVYWNIIACFSVESRKCSTSLTGLDLQHECIWLTLPP